MGFGVPRKRHTTGTIAFGGAGQQSALVRQGMPRIDPTPGSPHPPKTREMASSLRDLARGGRSWSSVTLRCMPCILRPTTHNQQLTHVLLSVGYGWQANLS